MESNQLLPLNSLKNYSGEVQREDLLRRSRHSGLVAGLNRAVPQCDDEKQYCTEAQKNPEPFQELHVPRKTPLTQQIRSDGKCISGVFSGMERAPVRARPLNCFHSTLKNRALKPPQCCTSESHNLGETFSGGPEQSTRDCTDHGDESSMPTCHNTSGHGSSGFQEVNRSRLTHCSLRADSRTPERAPVGAPSAQHCSANFSPNKVEKSPAKPQRNSVVVSCSDGPSRFPCGRMAGSCDSCSPLPAASVGHSLAAAQGVGSVGTISSAAVQDVQRPSAISAGGTRRSAEAPTPASPLSTEAAVCAVPSIWPSAQSVPSAGPPGPKSSPTAIAAVSAGNGPSKRPFLQPVGIISSPRVTRRQASAAALAEVVRIEDSSDEEGPSSLINRSGNPSGSPEEELENCKRIPQTTNGESVNYSPSGPHQGVRADASQETAAFILLAAALVGEDGHCCLLNPETLRRAAVEHAVVQQHEQQPCIGKNASATPTKENDTTEHAPQGDGSLTNCLLVLQVRREEAVVSLDLWRPLPQPYSPSANEQKNDCSHSYGETIALPVQDRLERLLNFPQQSISFLKCLKLYAGTSCPSFLNIGQGDKQEGSCRCACSSRKIRLCPNKSSSKSRASHDAKAKDRRHTRTCAREENPQEKHFGEDFPRNRKPFVLTGDTDATNVLAPDTFSSPARDGAASASPGESLTDMMQPAQLAAGDPSATRGYPDATTTARTATGMEATEYRESKTSSEVSYRSCDDREATGKAISSGTASEEHRRRTKNRTNDKRTKSANDSKKSQKSRRDHGSSRREGHSRRSRSPRGVATAKTKSQLPHSSQKVSAEENKKDGHFVTPRNALIVTDGKPFLGAELTTGDAELTRLKTHKPAQGDAEVDSCKMKGDKDSRNSSANLRVTSVTCKSNSKKRRQHSSNGSVKSSASCSLAINECKECHTTGEKAPKEHQPSKELPGAGTSASKSKCYCSHVFDCRKCHKACARCISAGATPHVPVLYLELCSSGTRSLYCSEILQRALELDSGQASCVASSVEKGQPSAEGAHAVACSGGVPAVLPTAHSTGSRCWNPHADGGRGGSSTSSKSGETSSISSSASSSTCRATTACAVDCNKEDSRHRRSSRKLHEVKDCEADSRHRASSGVKHSSGLSSRTKRECNSSSRRGHKCSKRQKRRRHGHSPTSETVVDETFEKLLSCSANQSVLACSICLDCCTTGCCSNSTTKSLLGASTVAKDTNKNKASVKLTAAGATTLGAAIQETSKGSLLKAEGPSVEKQTTGDLLREPIEQLPQRKGPWLLICVGPSLQAAPAKESLSSTYEGRKGAPTEPHSAQSDMKVSGPAGSGAHGSSTEIKLFESEYPSGCRGDLESLYKVILPSDVAAPPLYNLGGLESAGDPVDVGNLSMFFANCIRKQSGSHDHEDDAHFKGNRSQRVTELVLRISEVLHEFVLRSIGPWKAMRRSRSAIYSLSLEALVSSWRARDFRTTEHFSEQGERVDRRHLQSGSAAGLEPSRSAPCKANITGEVFAGRAGKRLATAVTSPAFDLLLDDKTLRRLSDKEFLDDTIIDFCLGFIVNHVRLHFFFLIELAKETDCHVHVLC
ncbi:Proteophosphoglycan ppg4, related [Eimeria necatrix]|uniref:Proteophosphoglycan ppg4, related n=1 Tax=Eimeria necatrix TaxID=51315 RepID=U6MLX0_9EIME|nr:Proteophosphoglycan ppg4, related [Eimeria necatrix]CDJ62645.1 Proteophosphoglycan ppg4, related [Eimeria necatrix]